MSRRTWKRGALAVAVGVGALVGPGRAAPAAVAGGDPPVTVTRLVDGSGNRLSSADAVNDRGEVLAWRADPEVQFGIDLFLWDRGEATPIEPASAPFTQAIALSNRGQVVGRFWSGPPGGVITPDAFSWREGRWAHLDDGGGHALAGAVNDRGQVLGLRQPAGGAYQPAVWDGRGRVTVAEIDGQAQVVDINNRGQALLNVETATGGEAVVWQVGGRVTPLGSLGGSRTEAYDINDAGEVTGASITADVQYHAFVWRRGRMTDLGTAGGASSSGAAINEHGEVAGTAFHPDGTRHAVLWDERGRPVDLGTAAGTAAEALSLNDRGEVVGFAVTATGGRRAVLWDRRGRAVDLDAVVAPDAHSGRASAINERGQIAGSVFVPGPSGPVAQAVLWTVRRHH